MPKARAHRTAAKKVRQQPETLRLTGCTPSLTVNDIQASLRWYRDVLGFTMGEEWKNGDRVTGAELKAGSVIIILNQDDFAKGRDRQKGVGMRLYFSTRQGIDDLAQMIQARGGTLAQGPTDQPWGVRDIALVDLDGYKITISSTQ